MSDLERRYRRLLAAYPRDHRHQHGEEMLDVSMAAADGRTKPGFRDTADLLWGAFRLHLRRVVGVDGGVSPRSVLAVVSLVGPVAILAGATTSLHELAWFVRAGAMPPLVQIPDAPVWFVWLAVAVFAVLGKQRVAAIGAWVGTAGLVFLATWSSMGWLWTTTAAGWVLLGAVTAVALTLSPGPVHGREHAGRAPVAVMAVTVGIFVTFGVLGYGVWFAALLGLVAFVLGAALACGFGTRVGRRAGLMIMVPVMSMLMAPLAWSIDGFRPNEPVQALMFFGAPLLVVIAAGVLPLLARRRPDKHAT